MSFKKYWQKHFNKDIQKTSSLENACRYVFNDQQAKIEALEAELAKEREQLKKANSVIEAIYDEVVPDGSDEVNFMYTDIYPLVNRYQQERKEIEG